MIYSLGPIYPKKSQPKTTQMLKKYNIKLKSPLDYGFYLYLHT